MSHTRNKHSNKPRQNMRAVSYNADSIISTAPKEQPLSRAWICGRFLPLTVCTAIRKLVKRGV